MRAQGADRILAALVSVVVLTAGCTTGTAPSSPGGEPSPSVTTTPGAGASGSLAPATRTPAAEAATTFQATADAGLAVGFPPGWTEGHVNESLAVTGGIFTAETAASGGGGGGAAWMDIRFWTTWTRGADAALDAFVGALSSSVSAGEPRVSYLELPVGRTAVLELDTESRTTIAYGFVDPRIAEMCSSSDGGYWLLFSFDDPGTAGASPRQVADAIVRSAAFVPFEGQRGDDIQRFVCPSESSTCFTCIDQPPPTPAPSGTPAVLFVTPRILDEADERDDVSGTGGPSLAIAADGTPVIAYVNVSGHLLLHACADPDCKQGTTRRLGADSGVWSAVIAIGPSGLPVVAYSDLGTVKLYVCTSRDCSSGEARQIDDASRMDIDLDVVVGRDGNPVVTYAWPGGGGLRLYACSDPGCTSGSRRLLDTAGEVGGSNSIAIGVDGNPIISYRDDTERDLKAFACSDPTCTTGTVRTLDSTGLVGSDSEIAIGADGSPVIGYRDDTHEDLRLFACATPTCAAGTARTLDWDGAVGWAISIAIGADGYPLVAHHDSSSGNFFRLYACASPSCETGTAWLVVDESAGSIGHGTPVAIGANGDIVLVYGEQGGNLKLVRQPAEALRRTP